MNAVGETLFDRIIYRVQLLGIAWMGFCSWLWLVAVIYFLYRLIEIEHWHPRRLSDFVLLVILPPLAALPFVVTRFTRKLVLRSSRSTTGPRATTPASPG